MSANPKGVVVLGFTGNLFTDNPRSRFVSRRMKESDIALADKLLAEHGLWIGMNADPPEPMPEFMKVKAEGDASGMAEDEGSEDEPGEGTGEQEDTLP